MLSISRFSFVLCALLAVACTVDVRDPRSDDGNDSDPVVDAGRKKDGGAGDAGSGTCAPACGENEQCVEGECRTASCTGTSEKVCDGECVNTSTNLTHCGDCNSLCTAGSGASATCSTGICHLRCVNDPDGTYCDGAGACSNGHCCPSGQSWCDAASTCIDLTSDKFNCGWCGHVCEAPENGSAQCSNSNCRTSCDSGFTSCNGGCADYASDPNNCGGCNNSCNGGQCVNRKCVTVVSCTINATSTWPSCNGFMVNSGQTVSMTASGSWSMVDFSSHQTCGPEGYASNPSIWGDYRYDTRFGHGALIYGVGTSGTSNNASGGFTSGSASWKATQTGSLIFQINDTDLSNNTGSMSVQVTVSGP